MARYEQWPTFGARGARISTRGSGRGSLRCNGEGGQSMHQSLPPLYRTRRTGSIIAAEPTNDARACATKYWQQSTWLKGLRCLYASLKPHFIRDGTTLFSLRWQIVVTQHGQPYLRQQARALRTRGRGPGSWPTPTPGDALRTEATRGTERLCVAVRMLHGPTLHGAYAPTTKRDLLAPEFAAWLMGIPATWLNHAPTEASDTIGGSRCTGSD